MCHKVNSISFSTLEKQPFSNSELPIMKCRVLVMKKNQDGGGWLFESLMLVHVTVIGATVMRF